jgi:putative transposase
MMKSSSSLKCKICHSSNTIRDGKIKGVQRWECRTCGRKFLENDALRGMKTSYVLVQSALRMYYEGMSLNSICKQIQQEHHSYISRSAVFNWINIFPSRVQHEVIKYRPEVGNIWVVDETILKICGQKLHLWDIVDTKTCFLLATRLFLDPDMLSASLLIENAIQKADKIPGVIISNRLTDYLTYIENTTSAVNRRKHHVTIDEKSNIEIERFRSTFQRRTMAMSDLKSVRSAIGFKDGWLIHYNYFKPNELLGGKTPAEMANIIPRHIEQLVQYDYQRRKRVYSIPPQVMLPQPWI